MPLTVQHWKETCYNNADGFAISLVKNLKLSRILIDNNFNL